MQADPAQVVEVDEFTRITVRGKRVTISRETRVAQHLQEARDGEA